MAKDYWYTVTRFCKDEAYFRDYITNEDKRFQTGPGAGLGEDFWKAYAGAYNRAKTLGDMIIRAKVINQRSILSIYHIWKDREALDRFENTVNPELFLKTLTPEFEISQFQCAIDEERKNKIFQLIVTQNKKILQVVREDHRQSGMTIGDPLKYPTLFVH